MDLKEIKISPRALERFQRGWLAHYGKRLEHSEEFLRYYLSQVKEVRPSRLRSLINEIRFKQGSRYFSRRDWIFVTDQKLTTVITVCWKKSYQGWKKVKSK